MRAAAAKRNPALRRFPWPLLSPTEAPCGFHSRLVTPSGGCLRGDRERGHGALRPPKPTAGKSVSTVPPGLSPTGFCRMHAGAVRAAATWFLRCWLWVLQKLVVCPCLLPTKRMGSRAPPPSTQSWVRTAMEKGRIQQWHKKQTTPTSRQVAVLKGRSEGSGDPRAEGREGAQSSRGLAGEAWSQASNLQAGQRGPRAKNAKDRPGGEVAWELCPLLSVRGSLRGTCHSLRPGHIGPEVSLKTQWPGTS
ncbi:hypothetical protein PAL_GLEAN10024768 [Pteropus alecto]|uniref:Uncharacterized protein n=1 Tax=Pteropus alecto TaxID=9402 RepID=L5JYN8_PTEAL|nr:hypothetical protein PAL_GLEAN10024768 [Pteropus alecto]